MNRREFIKSVFRNSIGGFFLALGAHLFFNKKNNGDADASSCTGGYCENCHIYETCDLPLAKNKLGL